MARRVWIHVGLPKTGTTYLQGLLWGNRAEVQKAGLLLPGTQTMHAHASAYVRERHLQRGNARAVERGWRRFVDQVNHASGDVLLTHELLAPVPAERAEHAIAALGGDETHIVITARDLARQIRSGWQQRVKQGETLPLAEFTDEVVHRGPGAGSFWQMQDPVDVAARWGVTLGADRVHVVTLPPSGSDPTLLWRRFAGLVDIDPDCLVPAGSGANESIGRVGVELLRRINEQRGDRFPVRGNHRWIRGLLANEILAARDDKEQFALDPSVHDWVLNEARTMVAELRKQGYDIVGDLADLVPAGEPEGAADPSSSSDGELLNVAIGTVLDLLDIHRRTVNEAPHRTRR